MLDFDYILMLDDIFVLIFDDIQIVLDDFAKGMRLCFEFLGQCLLPSHVVDHFLHEAFFVLLLDFVSIVSDFLIDATLELDNRVSVFEVGRVGELCLVFVLIVLLNVLDLVLVLALSLLQ